jgi:hypothetical protein
MVAYSVCHSGGHLGAVSLVRLGIAGCCVGAAFGPRGGDGDAGD